MYAHFAFCKNMHKISRPGKGNRIWVNRKRKFATFAVSDVILVYEKHLRCNHRTKYKVNAVKYKVTAVAQCGNEYD